MTDITDKDKREARKWAEQTIANRVNSPTDPWVIAARLFLATVDAPAPTLAEELRALGALLEEEGGAGAKSTCWAKDLAARAEQIEKERDEARAEVERLTAHIVADSIPLPMPPGDIPGTALPVHRTRRSNSNSLETANGSLPEPADVKPGEAWIVEFEGHSTIGKRDTVDEDVPWALLEGRWVSDSAIALVSRLVPAPRVITDPDELDKLPIKAVVLAGQESFQRGAPTIGFDGEHSDDWYGHGDTAGFTSAEVLAHGPVTVLWEAGE